MHWIALSSRESSLMYTWCTGAPFPVKWNINSFISWVEYGIDFLRKLMGQKIDAWTKVNLSSVLREIKKEPIDKKKKQDSHQKMISVCGHKHKNGPLLKDLMPKLASLCIDLLCLCLIDHKKFIIKFIFGKIPGSLFYVSPQHLATKTTRKTPVVTQSRFTDSL